MNKQGPELSAVFSGEVPNKVIEFNSTVAYTKWIEGPGSSVNIISVISKGTRAGVIVTYRDPILQK